MRCSFNEIEATLMKAAVGGGLPHGVAVDAARAGVWLCRHGQDGVGSVLSALRQADDVAVLSGHDGQVVWEGGAVIACLVAIDAVQSGTDGDGVRVRGLHSIDFLIGHASVVAQDRSLEFILRTPAGDLRIAGAWPDTGPVQIADGEEISVCLAAGEPAQPAMTQFAATSHVPLSAWQKALALAARTYVPSSQASRERGAGAGLIDND